MKILHVITRLIQGGAQQNTVLSCRAQVNAGHHVTLAFGPIHGPEGSLLDEAKQSGAEIVVLPDMVREVSPRKDVRCYHALRKLIRSLNPDIVHTHSSKAGILGRFAAHAERQRASKQDAEFNGAIVHTVHGLPFHDQQSHFVHGLYVFLERLAARRCDQLIAITPAMVEEFAKKKIAPPGKFSIIPSGVDLSRFRADTASREKMRAESRQLMGIPKEAVVVANLARLDPLKGHDDLLEIYPLLAAEFGQQTRFLFIGDGFYRKKLEVKIASLGLQDRVIITGYIPHKQVMPTLLAADVKVLPSYQEGQSRTLVEALLCKIPIVAYEVGGIPSVCIENVTGRLVKKADKVALAHAIIHTLKQPEASLRLAAEGRDFVAKQYSSQAMTSALEHLYQSIYNRPNYAML